MNSTLEKSKENLTERSLNSLLGRLPKHFRKPFWVVKRLNDDGKLPGRARFYTESIVTRVFNGHYGDDNVVAELEKMVDEYEKGVLV